MITPASVPSLEELVESRSRRLRTLVVGLTLVATAGIAVATLVRYFPVHAYGLAEHYRVMAAAGRVLGSGGNPYLLAGLHAAEQALDHFGSNQVPLDRFLQAPVVALLMEPLSVLPFWVGFGCFTVIGLGLVGLTLNLLARDLGWRHTGVFTAAVLATWLTAIGLLQGQLDAVLLGAVAGAMLLAWHGRPLPAGLVLGLIWLHPLALWPVPIFFGLALRGRSSRGQFAAGFIATSLVAWLLEASLLGSWWATVTANAPPVHQLAGIGGLLPAAPPGWGLSHLPSSPVALSLTGLALVGMAVFGVWMMLSPDWDRLTLVGRLTWAVSLPLGLWLVLSPFATVADDLLLLPLLMLTVGRDARRLHGLGLGLALVVMAVILLTWPSGLIPWPLPLVLLPFLLAALWRLRTDPRLTGFGAALCTMALVSLPASGQFHRLEADLTPVAAAILLLEAGRTCWMEVGGAGTGPAYFPEGGTAPGLSRI